MAAGEELSSFVREALGRAVPRAQIEEVLLQAGWEPEQVRGALAAFADLDFPIPVPKPKPYLPAREAFLYLVLFTTLYLSAYHLGSLFFHFVERALPDPALGDADLYRREASRWSVSFLVIAFPVFLYTTRNLARAATIDPAKRGSKVRRWLTYLTLFLAAGTLVGDCTALVFNLLSGELTLRFVLKALIVAALAGGIFGHYLGELRREEEDHPAPATGGRYFTWIASGAVALALIGSFALLDSPSQERVRRLDARRVEDLRLLAGAVDLHWSRAGALPLALEDLTREPGYPPLPADPETGAPYEYRALEAGRYELCAGFSQGSGEGPALTPADFWSHAAGRQCFQLEAKKPTR
ncbi:MAG: hypothetical protein IT369_21060 [Candidatus Latescibacteria bacterium]|nr:hypothetical protein [Candidatus Latescibacterota bacterium]